MQYEVKGCSGYTLIFNQLWRVELSNTARLLYIVGLSFRGCKKITQKLLIERANISRASFFRAQKELIKNGLMEVRYLKPKGFIQSVTYTFIEDCKEWSIVEESNVEAKKETLKYKCDTPIMKSLKELWS